MNKNVVYALVSAVTFTSFALLNKYAFEEFDPDASRFAFVFVAAYGGFAALASVKDAKKYAKLVKQPVIKDLAHLSVVGTVAIGLFVFAQNETTAINASMLSVSALFTTALFAWIVLKEKTAASKLIWVLVMTAGLYLAIVGLEPLSLNRGDIFILLSSILFGYSNVLSKVAMKTIPPGQVANFRLMFGGLVFLVIGLVLHGTQLVFTGAGSIPYVSAFLSWVTINLVYKAVDGIGPVKTIVLNMIHPIFTILGAYLFLNEEVTVLKIAGAAIVIMSVFMFTRQEKQKSSKV